MPYDMSRETTAFPVQRLLDTADLIGRGLSKLDQLVTALSDAEPGVRYWGAVGLAVLGNEAKSAAEPLLRASRDESASVRFAAAEALCYIGQERQGVAVLADGILSPDIREKLLATQFLVAIGDKARPARTAIKKALKQVEGLEDHGWYMREALTHLLDNWS
jgi:HEAT repeat protein